jgi:hypothetical protein
MSPLRSLGRKMRRSLFWQRGMARRLVMQRGRARSLVMQTYRSEVDISASEALMSGWRKCSRGCLGSDVFHVPRLHHIQSS